MLARFIIRLLCDVIAWTHANEARRSYCFLSPHTKNTGTLCFSLSLPSLLVSSSSPSSPYFFSSSSLLRARETPLTSHFTFTFWRQPCWLKPLRDYTSGLGLFSHCCFDILSYILLASTGLCWPKDLFLFGRKRCFITNK